MIVAVDRQFIFKAQSTNARRLYQGGAKHILSEHCRHHRAGASKACCLPRSGLQDVSYHADRHRKEEQDVNGKEEEKEEPPGKPLSVTHLTQGTGTLSELSALVSLPSPQTGLFEVAIPQESRCPQNRANYPNACASLSSVQNSICSLGKAHMRSSLSLRIFPALHLY